MPVPTYDQFIEPLLRVLAQHPDGMAARQAADAAAAALGVTEEQKQELLPSGAQPIYRNRAGWAHDRLKRAGLSSSPRRGSGQITQAGREFLERQPQPLPAEVARELAMGFVDVRIRPAAEAGGEVGSAAAASPDDRLGEAAAGAAGLHAMGYGTSRSDLQRVGGAGDGGIDGVISLDRLGLEKVYVQAKRWQASVGRPELQAFYGALAGHKARKGVFIATSSYTAQALEFARSVEGMVLIDGQRLASLMIDHEVGVNARVLKIPKIDSDYFDEKGA